MKIFIVITIDKIGGVCVYSSYTTKEVAEEVKEKLESSGHENVQVLESNLVLSLRGSKGSC